MRLPKLRGGSILLKSVFDSQRLKLAAPWLLVMFVATLITPWGWNIYRALLRQNEAMAVHSERITEGVRLSFTSATLKQALWLRDPASSGEWTLILGAVAAIVAVCRREWLAALLLAGALAMMISHVRLLALLACVVVIVGGKVLSSALDWQLARTRDNRTFVIASAGFATLLLLLCGLRCVDLVSNRYYFREANEIRNLGAGLSWWFP